ncbi:MAG: hypothetical protein ABJN34_14910 [Litoreibacter sp.]|uniref:hypothetical protein n=1 Tax=Litoreibacter sp. TaxID=1969459 RepID=UPI00329705FA
MITKELENILDALPSFLKIMRRLQNPLVKVTQGHKEYKPLETATKAVWLIVPFHFLAFFGMVNPQKADFTFVVILSLATLVLLMWLGTLIAAFLNWTSNVQESGIRDAYTGHWVVGLFSAWFFCVIIITLVNLIIWVNQDDTAGWPNVVDDLELQIRDWPFSLNPLFVVCIFVPTAACIALRILVLPKEKSGTFGQSVSFLLVCWLVCSGIISGCVTLLEPVISKQ